MSIYPWAKQDYRSGGDPSDLKDFSEDFARASLGSSWPYIYALRYPDHPAARHIVERLKALPIPHFSDSALGFATQCYYRASLPELAPPGITEEVKDFELAGVTILPDDKGELHWSHQVLFQGPRVGGEPVPSARIDLNRDFSQPGYNVEDLTLFRYMFYRRNLVDPQSREADYSGCDEISVQEQEGDQQLRLHIGFESEQNQCILSKMGPRDRMMWEAIIADFDEVLAVARPSADLDHIRASYEWMRR